MRIGIFGGTFDPVHLGHLIVAEAAADALNLDQVRLIPTCVQPFKVDWDVSDPVDRLALLRLAVEGNPHLIVDDREIRRGGVSYTVDTVESLRHEFPNDQLFLLVGADAARDLPRWRAQDRIRSACTVAVLSRPGTTAVELAGAESVTVPAIDISATQVRDRVRSGRSIEYLVPPAVAEYIRDRQLYR